MPLRLLLVEDEQSLADLSKRYLEKSGFQVEVSTDAASAKALLDTKNFALLITDLTLPGTSGEELVRQARELRPGIPVLVTSGYPYETSSPGVEFLQKPFLPKALVERVREMLRENPS